MVLKKARDVVTGDFVQFPGRGVADKVLDARTIATGPDEAARQLMSYESRWTLPLDEEVQVY